MSPARPGPGSRGRTGRGKPAGPGPGLGGSGAILELGPRFVEKTVGRKGFTNFSGATSSGQWKDARPMKRWDTPRMDLRRPNTDVEPINRVCLELSIKSPSFCVCPENTKHSSEEPGSIQNTTAG